MDKKHRYIVGTGWWCSTPMGEKSERNPSHPFIRSTRFHEIWKYFVFKYTAPYKVVVIDSASPYVPEPDDREEWIRLDKNYQSPYCTPEINKGHNGWMRGFTLGMLYARHCNSDFVYIEQDCIVIGKGWLSEIYKASEGKYIMVGPRKFKDCKPIPQPLQQSLVFVPWEAIPEFYYLLHSVPGPSMEQRFNQTKMPMKAIPFGYGRLRPIDWGDKHIDAQHWNEEQLMTLAQREGIRDWMSKELKPYKRKQA